MSMPAPRTPPISPAMTGETPIDGPRNNGSIGFEGRVAFRFSISQQKVYSSPDELINECIAYFEFSDSEPIMKAVHVTGKGPSGRIEYVPKPRPYSLFRLCTYLGIVKESWYGYRNDDALKAVVEWAEDLIFEQRYEGGVSENMNAMLIARRLGLSDKVETKNDTTMTELAPLVDEDMVANLTHPDDPDPTGFDSGIFPRPLYSPSQIAAGVPFYIPPQP